jgi:DNA-binding transcriptional MerR regulator
MRTDREVFWTLDELGAQVAQALADGYDKPANGQVRAVPDRRTIRYYTTLGLIDRPTEMRGRTAFYGRRHLWQLVAIKRLQARGLSLQEVQEHMLGLSDAALRRLARVDVDPPAPERASRPPARADFWQATPAEVAAPEREETDEPSTPVASLQGVRLSDDATLLLATDRPVEPTDIEAIRVAAGPLLKLLERRRLVRPRQERGTP